MGEVLAAARVVDTGRLHVPVGVRSDPDVLPRGRDDEANGTLAGRRVDGPTPFIDERESSAPPHPVHAGAAEVAATEAGHLFTLGAQLARRPGLDERPVKQRRYGVGMEMLSS